MYAGHILIHEQGSYLIWSHASPVQYFFRMLQRSGASSQRTLFVLSASGSPRSWLVSSGQASTKRSRLKNTGRGSAID